MQYLLRVHHRMFPFYLKRYEITSVFGPPEFENEVPKLILRMLMSDRFQNVEQLDITKISFYVL